MSRVSQEALNKASRCEFNFACKEDNGCPKCEVVEAMGETKVFIRKQSHPTCAYSFPFGFAHFCSCPARNEIFRNHGK